LLRAETGHDDGATKGLVRRESWENGRHDHGNMSMKTAPNRWIFINLWEGYNAVFMSKKRENRAKWADFSKLW